MATQRLCTIPDCGNPHNARGLCKRHYREAAKDGRIKSIYTRTKVGSPHKFAIAALKSDTDECILWPFMQKRGYGRFSYFGQEISAHRFVCEQAHGVADDMMATHQCGVRSCINPRHLRWGTAKSNVEDAIGHGTIKRHFTKRQTRALKQELANKRREMAERHGVSLKVLNAALNSPYR